MSPVLIGDDPPPVGSIGGGTALQLPPSGAAQQLQAVTALLGVPVVLGYGRHIVGGNVLRQSEDATTKARNVQLAIGQGELDALETLWINGVSVSLPDTSIVHFHPGLDGELGVETDPATRNQKICSRIPTSETPQLTWSGKGYLSLNLAADPAAPSPDADVRAVVKMKRVRIFDSSGTQTSYAYSVSPSWCFLDTVIEYVLQPHGRRNEALTTAQKARIDFPSFVDFAADCAADPGDGSALWETHVVFGSPRNGVTDLLRAWELILLTGRAFVVERNGKLVIKMHKSGANVLTATRDKLLSAPVFPVRDFFALSNWVEVRIRDLGSGAGDPAKDFQEMHRVVEDEDHQDRVGRVNRVSIDLQNSIPRRGRDIGAWLRDRQMKSGELLEIALGAEDPAGGDGPADLEPGVVITAPKDKDGFETRDYVISDITTETDFSRRVAAELYDASIFSSSAQGVSTVGGPAPGSGLASAFRVGADGKQRLADADRLNPSDASGFWAGTAAARLAQVGTTTNFDLGADTYKIGGKSVSYNAQSGIAAGSYGTKYIVLSDVDLAGGSPTVVVLTAKSDVYSNKAYVYAGEITLSAGGGGGGSGGGGGGAGGPAPL